MKKLLLLLPIAGFAQNNQTVTVNIKLHDVQTITVNGSKTINLEYLSQADYENGVNSYQTNHLNTFSTADYFVKTKVMQDNVITNNDIYLNGILQNLQPQTLFTSGAGVHNYDVDYKAKGNYEYLTKNKINYTIQVLYSVEPQ